MILSVVFVVNNLKFGNAVNLKIVKDRCEVEGVASFEELRDMPLMDFDKPAVSSSRSKDSMENLTTTTELPRVTRCSRLKFVNSKFYEFPVNFFEKLVGRDVREIIARDVGLNTINKDDFKSAGNVWNLKISANHINALKEKSFSHLESLRYLDLSSNDIRGIHDDAFDGLTSNLSKIDMSRNQLLNFKEKFILDMSKNPGLRIFI